MILTRLRNSFIESSIAFLCEHLSKRMKRLIFLASVSGRFKEPETFNNETLAKLNNVMQMGSRDAALMPAVQLSRAIWYGKTSREIIEDEPASISSDESRVGRAADRILSMCPKWLRYGDDSEMRPDLIKLLQVQPALLS